MYLGEAEQYYNSYLQATSEVPLVNNWDTQIYASSLLLWQLTGNKTYRSDLEVHWHCILGFRCKPQASASF